MRESHNATDTCGRMLASHRPSKKLMLMVSLYTLTTGVIVTCGLNLVQSAFGSRRDKSHTRENPQRFCRGKNV